MIKISFLQFLGRIGTGLGMALIGIAIIGIGAKIYTFSMKNGSFNDPSFLMILSLVIGIVGGLLIIYSMTRK